MPRPLRETPGGILFHILNRGVGRQELFYNESDYLEFEQLLQESKNLVPMRICAYCLMPNHWHLALWPETDGQLSIFMHRLTTTHTVRWRYRWNLVGLGPLYQGRFKSFPVENESYCLNLMRYIESNASRAGLEPRAELWRWSSLWRRSFGTAEEKNLLSPWPTSIPHNWLTLINEGTDQNELAKIRVSVERGVPFGSETWVKTTAEKLGIMSSLNPRGRPAKSTDKNRFGA